MSIQYRQKEVVCLFVHVDRLNKRETFDAHCINVYVCVSSRKKLHQNGQNRSEAVRAMEKLHPLWIVICHFFVVFVYFSDVRCACAFLQFRRQQDLSLFALSIKYKKFEYQQSFPFEFRGIES